MRLGNCDEMVSLCLWGSLNLIRTNFSARSTKPVKPLSSLVVSTYTINPQTSDLRNARLWEGGEREAFGKKSETERDSLEGQELERKE